MAKMRIPSRSGLVAEYLLSGDALDTSGSGNTGTFTNGSYATTDRGYQSQCGVFNGTSSRVAVASGPNLANSSFSISVWFKISGGTGVQDLVSFGDTTGATRKQFFMRNRKDNNTLCFSMYADDFEVAYTTTNGVWYNLTGTFNASGNAGVMYLNGQQIGTNTFGGAFTGGTKFVIGSLVTENAEWVNGNIQSVRIFNRVLSQSEIQDWYMEGLRKLGGGSLSGLMDGLVALWDCRTDAQDIVGGYNGSLGTTTQLDPVKGLVFDGTNNSRVQIAHNSVISPVNNFTIIATCTASSNGTIFGWDYNNIYLTNNYVGVTRYVSSNLGYQSAISATLGNKYQVAFTQSSTEGIKMYVDGTQYLNEPSLTNNTLDSTQNTVIGGRGDGNGPGNATVYEVLMFNRVLTPSEIKGISTYKDSGLLPFI